jgi:hypothetical protein
MDPMGNDKATTAPCIHSGVFSLAPLVIIFVIHASGVSSGAKAYHLPKVANDMQNFAHCAQIMTKWL